MDRSGTVYVTGYSDGKSGFPDYATIAYDRDGTQRWVRRYDSGDRDFATSLVTDNQGNVYVTGDSHVGEDGSNYTTLKYNEAGNVLWTKQYIIGYTPRLALDDSGNVYIAATSRKSGSFAAYVTAKLHTDGSQAWIKTYNGPGGYNDLFQSLVIDKSGSVYVTGSSADSLGISEYATVKYQGNGNELWVKRYSGLSADADVATAVGVDGFGNVYVTGGSQNTDGDFDFTTISYTQIPAAKVLAFSLINTDTDKTLATLKNGNTINLAALPSLHLNFRANTSPAPVGSVVFQLRGAESRTHTENIVPYALFADNNKGHFYSWIPTNGNYTLTATPYSGMTGSGVAGRPLSIRFTVTGMVVRSLVLVNAETERVIRTLTKDAVIDLATLPTTKLNIRAVIHPDTVGSVVFNLNNKLLVSENYAPYAIGGDIKGDLRPWTLPTGHHTLAVTPYSRPYGKGLKGRGYSLSFTVVDRSILVQRRIDKNVKEAVVNTLGGSESLRAIPNPFSEMTSIRFSVPYSGFATVQVYDLKGTAVARLYEANAVAGKSYDIKFQSKHLASGVYILRLATGKDVHSFKLVLIR